MMCGASNYDTLVDRRRCGAAALRWCASALAATRVTRSAFYIQMNCAVLKLNYESLTLFRFVAG